MQTTSHPFYTLLLTLLSSAVYGQNNLDPAFKKLEGIWIAEGYLNSFDKTLSSIKSKNAFDLSDPVGLRINPSEFSNGVLNIGYGVLHDHMLHPEISGIIMVDSEPVSEQGFFQINPQKADSLNFYTISLIDFFNDECKAYFSWSFSPDTAVILYRPKSGDDYPEISIRFKRISSTIKPDYPYPNPIYYYTRSRTLAGTYTLRNDSNQVLSSHFQIGLDGKTSGYAPFKDMILYFSTDIYCGYESLLDHVLICQYDAHLEPDCSLYIYKRIGRKTLELREPIWLDEGEIEKTGKVKYRLTRQ